MDDVRSLEQESQRLLTAIVEYLSTRKPGTRPPVLIGWWAVWYITRYAMSVDIDLVLNSRDRHSLLNWLKTEHGMSAAKPHIEGWRGAEKQLPEIDRPLIVDMATYEDPNKFYDRDDRLDFNLVADHHVVINWGENPLAIPTRSLLILFKTKAAYDREIRSKSPDATLRIEDKWHKDQADILAMLDPSITQHPLDPPLLHEQIERLPFLRNTLSAIPLSKTAVHRANITQKEAHARIQRLLALVR